MSEIEKNESEPILTYPDERIDEAWEDLQTDKDKDAKKKALKAMLEDCEPNYPKE